MVIQQHYYIKCDDQWLSRDRTTTTNNIKEAYVTKILAVATSLLRVARTLCPSATIVGVTG